MDPPSKPRIGLALPPARPGAPGGGAPGGGGGGGGGGAPPPPPPRRAALAAFGGDDDSEGDDNPPPARGHDRAAVARDLARQAARAAADEKV